MDREERSACLQALSRLARVDADLDQDPATTFLPLPMSRWICGPEVQIVLGARGAGKTALFRMLTKDNTRGFLARTLGLSWEEGPWVVCFAGGGLHDPSVEVLEDLEEVSDLDLRGLWAGLLLRTLAREAGLVLPEALGWLAALDVNDVKAWIARARSELGAMISALDSFDATLAAAERTVYCCYDALDRISLLHRGMRRRQIRALLAFWSALMWRYRRLRAKIFLREDLADPKELEFPDASKLLSQSATLTWTHEDLSRLVVRHLAAGGPEIRQWLGRVKGLAIEQHLDLGALPGKMPDTVRRAFTARLVGEVIGTGLFEVETGRWITGRLRDAHGQITPRVVLHLFGRAGELALLRARDHSSRSARLLAPEDLSAAAKFTSQRRVAELREDYPIVRRMHNLVGLPFPIPLSRALPLLAAPLPGTDEVMDGAEVVEELRRLGALSTRDDHGVTIVEIPDIYRFGFEIAIDYKAAFQSYLAHGRGELPGLQRGELPYLDEILAKELDRAAIQATLQRAMSQALSGELDEALAILQTLSELADHRKDRWLRFVVADNYAELVAGFDPKLALEFTAEARTLLGELPPRPELALLEQIVNLRECLMYAALGDLKAVDERLGALAPLAEEDLRGDMIWLKVQVALRRREPAVGFRYARELLTWGRTHQSELEVWRGWVGAAAAILVAGLPEDEQPSTGLLPWCIRPRHISPERIRLAVSLTLAPLSSLAESPTRLSGEQLARGLAGSLGPEFPLEQLRREAEARGDALLDDAAATLPTTTPA